MEKLEYNLIRYIVINRYIERLLQEQFYNDVYSIAKSKKEESVVEEIKYALIENTVNHLYQESSDLLEEIMDNKHMKHCYNHLFDCVALVKNENNEKYIVFGNNYVLNDNEQYIIEPKFKGCLDFLDESIIKIFTEERHNGLRLIK
jgi:uncharacterized membrane protein YheB (UPF0754 family)